MKRRLTGLIIGIVVLLFTSGCSIIQVDTVVIPPTTEWHDGGVELLPVKYQFGPTGQTEDDPATIDAYDRCVAAHLECDIERTHSGLEVIGYPVLP